MRSIAGVIAIAVLALALTAAAPAQAETLSGTVSGQKGGETEPLAEVVVSAFDPSTGTEVGSTSTNAGGDYSIELPSGVFDVRFDPGSESPFDSTTAHEVDTSKPRTLNVVLVLPGTVKLTGRLLTASGTPIAGAKVGLNGFGTSTTDAEGSYSFSATPGTRQLGVSSGTLSFAGLPQSWFVETAGFALDSDQVRDLVLPPTSTLTVEALGDEDAPIPAPSWTCRSFATRPA